MSAIAASRKLAALWTLALLNCVVSAEEGRAPVSMEDGNAKAVSPPERSWRVTAGHGYSVCEGFVRNLNAFSLRENEVPRACELKIHPKFTAFAKPEWEELDLKSNLRLVHAAELLLKDWLVPRHNPSPVFEEWAPDYERKVENGEFQPRLRRTRLALNQKGPETLVWYEPDTRDCERYPDTAGIGGHIFVLRDNPQQPLKEIYGSTGSHSETDVIAYRGKAFFLSGSSFGPRRVQLTISAVFSGKQPPNSPYLDRYVLTTRCEIEFGK